MFSTTRSPPRMSALSRSLTYISITIITPNCRFYIPKSVEVRGERYVFVSALGTSEPVVYPFTGMIAVLWRLPVDSLIAQQILCGSYQLFQLIFEHHMTLLF